MLKKAGAVALSASMLFASNCAISTKAAEEKATVAAEKEISLQDRAVGFFKEHGLKLGIGTVILGGAIVSSIAVHYTFFRDHLQKEIDRFVKLAKVEIKGDDNKKTEHVKKLKAEAEALKKAVIWSIVKTKENEDKDFGQKVGDAFSKVKLEDVKDVDSAATFVKGLHDAVDGLEKTKCTGNNTDKPAYRARKARLNSYDKEAEKSMKVVIDMLKCAANDIKSNTIG